MFTTENLISALYKLSQEDFNVTDDTILDKLYVHILKSQMVRDNISSILPMTGKWIEVIIKGWTDKKLVYGVQIFSVRLIGYVGSYSQGFTLLQDRNVLTFIKDLISSTDIQNDSCLMVPLINTCEMVLNHREGWEWITKSMILEHVVKTVYDDQSIYTKRAGVKFISQLLTKSISYDENVGNEMIDFLCKPLVLNHLLEKYQNNGEINQVYKEWLERDQNSGEINQDCKEGIEQDHNIGEIDQDRKRGLLLMSLMHRDKTFYEGDKIIVTSELLKAAKLLCDILENVFSKNIKLPMRFKLIHRADGYVCKSVLATDILDNLSSDQNHNIFALLLIMFDLSNIIGNDSVTCKPNCCLLELYSHIEDTIKSFASLHLLQNVVDFCVMSLSWVAKFKYKTKTACTGCCIACYYNESKIVTYMMQYLNLTTYSQSSRSSLDGIVQYITEMLTVAFSAKMSSKNDHQFIELGLLGVIRILDFIKYPLNLKSVFVDLISCLNRTVNNFCRDEESGKKTALLMFNFVNNFLDKVNVPLAFMDHLRELYSEEKFINCILRLLGKKASDIRVTIISLQILNKILKCQVLPDLFSHEAGKHPPTLRTLINKPILTCTLECSSWEVRDTVLELLQSVIDLAELMPWYFLDGFTNTLLYKIFKMAADDESAYVRASALKFFSKSIKCKFFNEIILPSTLLELAIKILLEDNMPMARISACNLISALYINYVPGTIIDADRIFDTVYLASTKDLDWEVKVAALNFWQCTINKHIMDQKIPYNQTAATLQNLPVDKQETSSRIIKVLDTMGEIGCLKVVWLGVTDDCDLKVSEQAQSIVESLENLNVQWSFLEELMKVDNSLSSDEEKSTSISYRRLTPKDFYSLLQKENWREKIASRKNWIENTCDNLESLLDHILNNDNTKDDFDHNAIDCY